MTLSDEEKASIVKVRLEAAWQALHDARQLSSFKSFRGSMNRAYYAMFHALSALAVHQGVIHKKHTQLIAYFHKEFAHPEKIARTHGRELQRAFQDRTEADYQDYVRFTQKQVDDRSQSAEAFIKAIEEYIQNS